MDHTERSDLLVVKPEDRVSLSVRELTVSVANNHTSSKSSENYDYPASLNILDGISLDLGAGQMMAIMGGSGSGKTTLLNTLSARLNVNHKGMTFSGSVEYKTQSNVNKIKNSYLLQNDIFLAGLSVKETLKYQADLRMPSSVKKEEKLALIDTLLDTLELTHLSNLIVLSFTKKINLSGGERRRLSLAIQLLNKPSIIFLDEPTTGLDASSALKLVKLIKKLASPKFGITVILSIHQPRIEVSNLFDTICLLTRGGKLVYCGSLRDSYDYFGGLDFITDLGPPDEMLEYIIGLSVKDYSTRAKEDFTERRIGMLVAHWRVHSDNILGPAKADLDMKGLIKLFSRSRKDQPSFLREVMILTKRTFILTLRDKWYLIALNGGTIFMAASTGWMFYKPPKDPTGIRSTISSLYAMLEIIGFSPVFLELERLWDSDGMNFVREYQENYVSIPGFVLSRRLGKLFLEDLPVGALFGIITYFMWGLRGGVGHFFIYFLITVLVSFIGMATAMVCFALGSDLALSTLILNVFYQLQNSACGYFVNAKHMPVYVRWIKYLAYFWYAFGGLTSNQFTKWEGHCPHADKSLCVEYTGKYQLHLLGYPEGWIGAPIGYLLIWLFGLYGLALVALYFRSFEMEVSKPKTNKFGDEELGDDELIFDDREMSPFMTQALNSYPMSDLSPFSGSNYASGINSPRSNNGEFSQDDGPLKTDINIRKISLSVSTMGGPFSTELQHKDLLQGLNADFESGSINIVMGPSGSGKTTLLNFLSHRLHRLSKFKLDGQIMLNEVQEISAHELARISSYVSQQDDTLISTLTVRETLYFQAKLRLPRHEQKRIKPIVNTLIRRTGLIECADILIGSDLVKGISGGEKRRLSIAIQLLSKPKILFLDEPTSGLDSATALSVLELLKKLATRNGTTIIATVHQPNEEMVKIFDNVLILVRGGRAVYNGKVDSMPQFFGSNGYVFPSTINPLTYILDLVTKRDNEKPNDLKTRIDNLVKNWNTEMTQRCIIPTPLANKNTLVDFSKLERKKSPFFVILRTIAYRQFLNTIRNFDILFAKIIQTVLLGVVHTLFFARLSDEQYGISNRLGLIQEVLNLYFVGLINNVSLYPIERDIFYLEYKDELYGVAEFSLSYFLNEFPLEVIPCLIFSVLVVFAVGLPPTAGMFFAMFFVSLCALSCGESLGIFGNSLFDHLGLATNVLLNLAMISIFMAGTMSLTMPGFFTDFNYINPMAFAVGICTTLIFQGHEFKCPTGNCEFSNGDDLLRTTGLTNGVGLLFGALVACLVVYRVVAIASVFIKVRWFI